MLSNVELNERLRALNIVRRVTYSLLLSLLLAGGFVVAAALSVTIVVLLAQVVVGGALVVPDDIILLGFPVVIAFMLTTGLIGLAVHEGVLPGETISRAAQAALRSGAMKGFIVGALFGFVWALIFQTNLVLYALMIGLAISLANGLFGALTSIAEPVCLKLIRA